MYDLKKRTKVFALKCILLSEKLPDTFLGKHIKGQLIRSGTSVAANYRAAKMGQTKAVFISKISIVIEESDESEFWLEIINEKNLLKNKKDVDVLLTEAHELTSIFVKSRMTAQSK
jgi:four helix bundle protein